MQSKIQKTAIPQNRILCRRCWKVFDLPNITVKTKSFVCPSCQEE